MRSLCCIAALAAMGAGEGGPPRNEPEPVTVNQAEPENPGIHEKVEEVFLDARPRIVTTEDGQNIEIRYTPQEWTLKALRRHGDGAVRYIAAHLNSKDESERVLAVQLLANQASPRAIEPIASAFKDPSPRVRLAAVQAAHTIRGEKLVALLRVAACDDADASVKKKAGELLQTAPSKR